MKNLTLYREVGPDLQQRMARDERELENDHSESDAPMATDGDRYADDGDDECDQLNRTNDCETTT